MKYLKNPNQPTRASRLEGERVCASEEPLHQVTINTWASKRSWKEPPSRRTHTGGHHTSPPISFVAANSCIKSILRLPNGGVLQWVRCGGKKRNTELQRLKHCTDGEELKRRKKYSYVKRGRKKGRRTRRGRRKTEVIKLRSKINFQR